jgi:hypothetical protein
MNIQQIAVPALCFPAIYERDHKTGRYNVAWKNEDPDFPFFYRRANSNFPPVVIFQHRSDANVIVQLGEVLRIFSRADVHNIPRDRLLRDVAATVYVSEWESVSSYSGGIVKGLSLHKVRIDDPFQMLQNLNRLID